MNEPADASDARALPDGGLPHDRFTTVEKLGSGGQGTSYRAEDTETGGEVVVKRLAVEALEDWKSVELFERSVEVLQRLDHPAIPDYVDAFEGETESDTPQRLYVAREFVDGDSLQDLIDDGERFTEDEVREIAIELLEILDYLHGRDPPVVHRDIKPANIIRRPDGSLALVDFGAVQKDILDEKGGSTVVGTTGYVPPEQLTGEASPASDLYAVGATLVHLLTHKPPSELPVSRMTIQFRDHTDVSEEWAAFLDRLLAPNPENRPPSAEEARRLLEAPQEEISPPDVRPRTHPAPPDGSDLTLEETDDRTRIVFPGRGVRMSEGCKTAMIVFPVCGFGCGGTVALVLSGYFGMGLAGFLLFGTLAVPVFGTLAVPAVVAARVYLRSGGVDLVIDGESVRVRMLAPDGSPMDTLYKDSVDSFPGIEERPYHLANAGLFTHVDPWQALVGRAPVGARRESYEFNADNRPPFPEKNERQFFLTISPESRFSDSFAGQQPHVFIEPGADLSLGERRWVIEVVERAVESRRD